VAAILVRTGEVDMLERGIAVLSVGLVAASAWWLGVPAALSSHGSGAPVRDRAHPVRPIRPATHDTAIRDTAHDGGVPGGVGVPRRAVRVTVVRLVDGDTLIVRSAVAVRGVLAAGETRVRLLEVDTPESVEPGAPVECFAHRATEELARLAPPGSEVSVTPDLDLLDPYGRTLLYVWNARGGFVNLQLVRSGAAESVLYEPNDRYIDVMRRAEAGARASGVGLWGRCDYFGQPA
jgi:micrococcal nuclease